MQTSLVQEMQVQEIIPTIHLKVTKFREFIQNRVINPDHSREYNKISVRTFSKEITETTSVKSSFSDSCPQI
jgi:hypothetical protein